MTGIISSDTPTAPGGSAAGVIRRWVGIIVLVVIAGFLGRAIWTQWAAIRGYAWDFRPGYLGLSAVLVWADFIILIFLWKFLLHRITGKPLAFAVAYRVWFLSNFGKYIPGKIWTLMGMAYMLKGRGYPAPLVLASAVLNQALSILSGILFAVTVLGTAGLGLPFPALAGAVFLGLFILYPPVFERLLNTGLRMLKRDPVRVDLPFPAILSLFAVYVITWMVYGAAFWLLMQGLGVRVTGGFWSVSAIFAASYILGFLALLAPGGLGPREGVLTLLLGPYLPTGLAAPIAIVARIWLSLLELLGALPLIWWRDRSDTS